jgi:hypothetical protein
MQAIASYLFEHSDNFKDVDYLALMNLVSSENKTIMARPLTVSSVRFPRTDDETPLILMNLCSPVIDISEEIWNDRLKPLLINGGDGLDGMMSALYSLVPEDYNINYDVRYKYCFTLPNKLTNSERQDFHIMSKTSRKFFTKSFYEPGRPRHIPRGQWAKKLHLCIVDF